MGLITSMFVRKVVACAVGVDQGSLLRSIGLDPDAESDVAQMVDDAAYYALLERIAEASNGAVDLPLRVGSKMRCDDYGAFGLAWKTAPTLRASFARAERYWRLLTSVVEYEVRLVGDDAYFILHRTGERRLGACACQTKPRWHARTSIIRQVAEPDFAPLAVYFKHPAPASIAGHEAYFGCPVQFDAALDALMVAGGALNRPNRLADAGVTTFLLKHLDTELERAEALTSLRDRVRDVIAQTLSEGVPKIQDVAKRLGLGERSLQRRLGEDGLSFQKLVDEARRDLAEGLLAQSDYPLAEVAYLTGFSEQSAFNRAFKRWFDRTPAAYRTAMRPV